MGMSASQARLGTITARLHDVEGKAQHVQAQKVALATDKDKIYQDYCEALDKTKIQVAYTNDDGSFNYVDGNYASVCSYNEDRIRQYALQDAETGKVLLDKDVVDKIEGCTTLDEFIEKMSEDGELTDSEEIFYQRLWELVQENGYQELDPQYTSGDDSYTWFNNMIEAGWVLVKEYIPTGSSQGWSDTDVTTSVNSNYLQEVEDETYVKKAEATYEHELNLINAKDKKFDTELSKLETEEKSLTTEIESIEKSRDDNIERTFGIFS